VVAPYFLDLPTADQRDVLEAVAAITGLPPRIIEKDVWVCWSLAAVFSAGAAVPMAFKGGTSLSKVFGVIDRFSEDLDLTIGFLQADEPIPKSRNQRDKMSFLLRERVAAHIYGVVMPHLRTEVGRVASGRTVSFDGADVVTVSYASCLKQAGGYVEPQVRLEFGGRNRITPNEWHTVSTYIEAAGIDVMAPRASVMVLSPSRTFWEKVTLVHAACSRPEWRSDGARISRHWSDLASLAQHPVGERALADRAVFEDVVRIKSAFWSTVTANYGRCLTGECRLVPRGELLKGLQRDYREMISAGMFASTPLTFEELLDCIRGLESRINAEFTRRPGTD
jgi:hypothetical protein